MDNIVSRVEKFASNWQQWKFPISNLLWTQVHDGVNALGVTARTVVPPTPPPGDANDAAIAEYNVAMTKFDKLDAIAVTIMTTAMKKEIYSMVMMHQTAKEIWNKLLSIYEQKSGQRLDYLICQLFNYRKDQSDSIAQHVAKLEAKSRSVGYWTFAVAIVVSVKQNSEYSTCHIIITR